jgi:hypothetical protein
MPDRGLFFSSPQLEMHDYGSVMRLMNKNDIKSLVYIC